MYIKEVPKGGIKVLWNFNGDRDYLVTEKIISKNQLHKGDDVQTEPWKEHVQNQESLTYIKRKKYPLCFEYKLCEVKKQET